MQCNLQKQKREKILQFGFVSCLVVSLVVFCVCVMCLQCGLIPEYDPDGFYTHQSCIWQRNGTKSVPSQCAWRARRDVFGVLLLLEALHMVICNAQSTSRADSVCNVVGGS